MQDRQHSKERMLPQGFLVQCTCCNSFSRLPHEIRARRLPLALKCPFCDIKAIWISVPILPRIPPMGCISYWAECDPNSGVELKSEVPEVPDVPEEKTEAAELQQPVPYWQLATELGDLTKQLFEKSNTLRDEIDKFASLIGSHFFQEWQYADSFKTKWNRGFLYQFLKWPFTLIPSDCEDELAKDYTRWLICPKFFDPGYGWKIQTTGGMRIELICAYSRFMFPLETDFIKEFQIPENLDLRVIGNKIVGASLQFCWKDIPGVVADDDHNSEWASVYISDPLRAKMWLAKRGIRGWEAKPIQPNELNVLQVFDAILDSDLFMQAWNEFVKYGRLGVFWPNIMFARRFAILAGLMIKGVTAIFVAGKKEEVAWRGLYNIFSSLRSGIELAYFQNGELILWDAVLQAKCIIVDLNGGVDPATLDMLFRYTGHLIILGSNPIIDLFTTNHLVAKVHALCGFENYQIEEPDVGQVKGSSVSLMKYCPQIHEAMKKFMK